MKYTNKGWIAALITAFLWALYALFLKTASTYMDNVNGLVVVLQAMVVGSFFLLILAGPGRLSLDTLRSGYTWSFGTLQILSNIFSFAALSYALSATSQTLLTRFSIVLSVIVILAFERVSKKPSELGFVSVLVGIVTVAYSIDAEHRAISLFWIFLMCLAQVARSRVAQKHKQSNQATGDFKTELRVTGYILAITSGFYALLLFVMMNLGFNIYIPQVIPSATEFFALKPLLFAMCIGAVLMATMRYSELIATKHIGGANFLTVTAFTPLCAFTFQWIFALFNIIPAPITNKFEIIGGFFIVMGAVLLARKEVQKERLNRKSLIKEKIA